MNNELCTFEVELLEAMNGTRPAFPWGAAVGAALEVLKGRRLIAPIAGVLTVTDEGRTELKRRAEESNRLLVAAQDVAERFPE